MHSALTNMASAAIWDGFVGSLVAAIIGGLVALGVVVLTNRHNLKLADRELQAAEKAAQIEALGTQMAAIYAMATHASSEELAGHAARASASRYQMQASGWDGQRLADVLAYWTNHVVIVRKEIIGMELLGLSSVRPMYALKTEADRATGLLDEWRDALPDRRDEIVKAFDRSWATLAKINEEVIDEIRKANE